jgi:hypothetical protein
LLIVVSISDGVIGLAGHDVSYGAYKKERTKSSWSLFDRMEEWGVKVSDSWFPKRFAFSMSDDANSLFGHTCGGIVSLWFINVLVICQIEPFDGVRNSR